MSKRRTDPIAVVEAAYSLDQDPQSWLERIVELAHPSLDHGLGVFAYEYDLRDPAKFLLGSRALKGVDDEMTAGADTFTRSLPAEVNRALYPRTPYFATATERLGFDPTKLPKAAVALQTGMTDGLAATGAIGDGRGVVVGAALGSGRRPDPRLRDTWSRITMHLAAAYRLRCALREGASFDPLAEAAAILDPQGTVQHAVGPAKHGDARELLREAAVRIDRARGALRHNDAERALELWRALVDGRWTLVDRFDSDGRRFVVAVKNAPRLTKPLRLTQRERQVVTLAAAGHANKLIAYELGISMGNVAATLSRAMQKIGVRSRAALAALMRDVT